MSDYPVTEMSEQECWESLRSQEYGRLATSVAGDIAITPVNYVVVDDKQLVFRTAEGSKLVSIAVASSIAFEIDDISGTDAWSVIARGTGRIVESGAEKARMEDLPLHPWVDTVKEVFVVIEVDELTGRRFQLTR